MPIYVCLYKNIYIYKYMYICIYIYTSVIYIIYTTYISGYQNENDNEETKPSYQVLRVLCKRMLQS